MTVRPTSLEKVTVGLEKVTVGLTIFEKLTLTPDISQSKPRCKGTFDCWSAAEISWG